MPARKGSMGRGLSALIGGATPAEQEPAPAPPTPPGHAAGPGPAPGPLEVPIERIVPNPYQPRQEFATDALDKLAESIREHGIIQPLIVRQLPADRRGRDGGPQYQIVAG